MMATVMTPQIPWLATMMVGIVVYQISTQNSALIVNVKVCNLTAEIIRMLVHSRFCEPIFKEARFL